MKIELMGRRFQGLRLDEQEWDDRRYDPRVDFGFSLNNWLRGCSHRMHVEAMVIADVQGEVLAEHGAGGAASFLARIPKSDPLYRPDEVEGSLYDPSEYIRRLNGNPTTKIWPFRFARGVGYLVCVMQQARELVHAECEEICSGFRRIRRELSAEGQLL